MPRARRRWWPRLLLALLAVALALAAVLSWGIAAVGRWLVVADPLEKAPAIVVLAGGIPFRAMEGAALYRDGWGREVWLTREAHGPTDAAFARLGIAIVRDHEYNREVLVKSGVPDSAVRVLEGPVVNTVDEVGLVADELRRRAGDRVIIVTSKFHTRRVRATWRALVGDSPRAIVRPAGEDYHDPAHWWRSTRDVLAVSREVFAMVNVWAGFPVQPGR